MYKDIHLIILIQFGILYSSLTTYLKLGIKHTILGFQWMQFLQVSSPLSIPDMTMIQYSILVSNTNLDFDKRHN